MDYFTSLSIDEDSSEAFNVAKKQDRAFFVFVPYSASSSMTHLRESSTVVGTALKALGWHFSPWAPKFIEVRAGSLVLS